MEGLEGQGLDHEQVCCPDGLGVVGEEGTPALAGRPSWPAARRTPYVRFSRVRLSDGVQVVAVVAMKPGNAGGAKGTGGPARNT
jgi:hypothetical protein